MYFPVLLAVLATLSLGQAAEQNPQALTALLASADHPYDLIDKRDALAALAGSAHLLCANNFCGMFCAAMTGCREGRCSAHDDCSCIRCSKDECDGKQGQHTVVLPGIPEPQGPYKKCALYMSYMGLCLDNSAVFSFISSMVKNDYL